MKRILYGLPLLLTLVIITAMVVHGPIAQFAHYHDFADQTTRFGVSNGLDVLSNLPFLVIGVWGLARLRSHAFAPALRAGWVGYRLMLVGLILVALGSGFYHLHPDNARLVWDRLPIALVCAGLLSAVRAETRPGQINVTANAWAFSVFAAFSVAWWYLTGRHGEGDLRPYLLLQALPLVLIPLWQAAYDAPPADRRMFGLAMLLYVAAKVAEMHDQQIFAALGWISGHTLKHLLAGCAVAVIVRRLVARVEAPPASPYILRNSVMNG